MSEFQIFTMDNCGYCEQAKSLLRSKGQAYQETKVGKDITRSEFLNQYPSQRTLPMIMKDGARLGGLSELRAHFDMMQTT